jgi:hypothetical protein
MAWRCMSKKCKRRDSVPIKIVKGAARCFMCGAHLADLEPDEIERLTYKPKPKAVEEKEAEVCIICGLEGVLRMMYVKPSTGNRWWNMVCLTCEPYLNFKKRMVEL